MEWVHSKASFRSFSVACCSVHQALICSYCFLVISLVMSDPLSPLTFLVFFHHVNTVWEDFPENVCQIHYLVLYQFRCRYDSNYPFGHCNLHLAPVESMALWNSQSQLESDLVSCVTAAAGTVTSSCVIFSFCSCGFVVWSGPVPQCWHQVGVSMRYSKWS